MAPVIDSDQHLYETRTMWRDHVDPEYRDDALHITDDELGYPWLMWGERKLSPVDVQFPRETTALGDRRERIRQGLPAETRYDDELPADYWDASARADADRGNGLRRMRGVPELRFVVGTHPRPEPARADCEHDRVEPLVRIGCN